MKNNSPLASDKSAVKNTTSVTENETSTGILKYLVEIASRLTELKSGMENNLQHWENLPKHRR